MSIAEKIKTETDKALSFDPGDRDATRVAARSWKRKAVSRRLCGRRRRI